VNPSANPNLSLTPHPKSRVTNWGTCTAGVDFPIRNGVFLRLVIEGKNYVYIIFVSKYSCLCICLLQWILSKSFVPISINRYLLFSSPFLSQEILEVHGHIAICRRITFARVCLWILVLNLNHGDRLYIEVSVALVDSQHGSVICVERSGTERWHNGNIERTSSKKFVVRFWNFAKKQNLGWADCSWS